jgi:hypothetical protein
MLCKFAAPTCNALRFEGYFASKDLSINIDFLDYPASIKFFA